MSRFMFATGIENSYPTIVLPTGETKRVDEMAKTGHYGRWREDFQLVKELGLKYLRYGPPYYKAHAAAGRYDWAFADETFNALKELGITPIVELCHFGVPDWVGDFQNTDWPPLFAEYARAFAGRFPWVRLYTPVGQMHVTAVMSGRFGRWNERLSTRRGYVTALKNLCRANLLAMRAILGVRPDAIFIQSESTEHFHPADPSREGLASYLNERRFLSLDLTYGHNVSSTVYEYLLGNGMTAEEYRWFGEQQMKARCIMGTDYYANKEVLVESEERRLPALHFLGYYSITRQYFERYHLPVMNTETNTDRFFAEGWLARIWSNVLCLKRDGIPVLGFTWHSLTDQVDWESGLTEDKGDHSRVGLYDLDRKITPAGEAYRLLTSRWRDILPVESLGLQA
ncbi:MAG: family 1 glycosylhydrolase [Acidobacteriota bacterium]|nr:family 1 glycosylhydrolase [Acidobacteriota bacterium]